jgi:SOS-response transcriptional repressor LexA
MFPVCSYSRIQEKRGWRVRWQQDHRFVTPAADALEGPVDLTEVLDLHRPHRYPVRVVRDALNYRGICDGDVLIACTATPPTPGRVVIAMVSGEVADIVAPILG